MSGLSTYVANAVLNWVKGTPMPADPTAVYVALHTADPTDAGTTAEATTTIDATGRKVVTFGAITAKVMANDTEADFGTADGAATITHFSLWDDASAGNCLGTAALATPRTIAAADPVKFLVGDLTYNLTTP